MAEPRLFSTDGQQRRAWLDDKNRKVDEMLRYYLGPSGLDKRAKAVTGLMDFTDAGDYREAAAASRSLWNDPSFQNAVRYATAGTALALPMVSAKMANAGGGILSDAIASGADDVRRFVGSEDGAIRAYHGSPHDFTVFDPSKGGRGASFFASTPELAKKGGGAGQNELARLAARSDAPKKLNMYEVNIDPSKIDGLSLKPEDMKWWDSLPDEMTADQFNEALGGSSQTMQNQWYFLFDEVQKPGTSGAKDADFIYRKRSPTIGYDEAVKRGRNVYGQQIAHYGPGSDEVGIAERLRERGQTGYLVQDEAGVSLAAIDPSIIEIVRKYGIAGAATALGMSAADVQAAVQQSEGQKQRSAEIKRYLEGVN